jgi:hypothetical protein
MATYLDAQEDYAELFQNLVEDKGLSHLITVRVIYAPDLKDVGQAVKTNDITRFLSGTDVVIKLNEDIMDRLSDEQRLIVAEELITQVEVSDAGKVSINKGDIQTHLLLLKKHTLDTYEALQLSVQQIKEKLKEEKKK